MRTVVHITAAVLVLAFAIGGAAWLLAERPRPEAATPSDTAPVVEVMPVALREHAVRIAAQGTVTPPIEIELVAEVGGRVVSVAPALASGGFFDAGTVLVQLDPRDYELAVTRARAEVAQAEMQLEIEQAEAATARAEWETLGLQRSPSPLVLRGPQVARAEATLAAAQAALQLAELQRARTALLAPFAGRVRVEDIDVGQYVRPGVALATIYAIDSAEVRLPLADDSLAFLDIGLDHHGSGAASAGPAVVLRADFAGTTHHWRGRLDRVEGQIDAGTGTVYVVARVDRPYDRGDAPERPPLAVGMFVLAEIEGKTLPAVAELPAAAVGDDGAVWIVDGDDRLARRQVRVARREGDRVLIDDGLTDGDRVCVTRLLAPHDGMRVRVESAAPRAPR